MPVQNTINNQLLIHDAKNSFHTKEQAQANLNPTISENPDNGKYTTKLNLHAMGEPSTSSRSTSTTNEATTTYTTTSNGAVSRTRRGSNGRNRRSPQPTHGTNSGIHKSKRGKGVSLHGDAREEAYAQLPTITVQVLNGHQATTRPNCGQQSHDLSTLAQEDPSLSRAGMDNGDPTDMNLNPAMNRPTNFIIWNIRGGNNDDFKRNFREMVDTHRPCMVALLKTKIANHTQMLDDFGFSEMIAVPAEGQSEGMMVMWNHNVVTVQNFIHRNQEIYATIEVVNPPREGSDPQTRVPARK
ncbi:uncharacterized protein LOC142176468 [Nicotiana tabacum]|uniref:Uncharacterized protein LOC142176468 n=1 Tax=Nicotiana tabacum TaxID=4097 RepID=A0AC58TTH8_TOBAC